MTATIDRQAIREALDGPGITALRGAFPAQWADRLRADIEREFTSARAREGGAVGRGHNRWYVEVHPEAIAGFVDIVSHPWFVAVCDEVLGADYRIVEIGFDIPFPGARDQPWHRDFPAPPETTGQHRLTSLAFNLTAVDTAEDMGPFEIAPGTQWDDHPDFDHGMFPPQWHYPRYEQLAERKYPRRGDISARSALTIHRGTASSGTSARPVLVVGVDAPGAGHDEFHDLQVTRGFQDALLTQVRNHLAARVVDELTPIVQQHTIEGLVMGDAEE
ncbi:phytanoyl-CoA dioxygenase family protein [uncultured Jatrophihabitans sp.]|uniref:phytanoyl-CoA dioxygenase family protein n=1 Tax=uncultured Jatrophihabitans sp. TaxID=1610747 RepID=UPI0035CC331A